MNLVLLIGDVRERDQLAAKADAGAISQPVEPHPHQTLSEFCAEYCITAVDAGELKEISRTFACRLHLFQDGLYQEQIARSGESIFARHPYIDAFENRPQAQPERVAP